MSEWISVKDRVPPIREWVLLRCECKEHPELVDPEIFVGCNGKYMIDGEYDSAYGDGYIPFQLKISHWMSLPKPPKV